MLPLPPKSANLAAGKVPLRIGIRREYGRISPTQNFWSAGQKIVASAKLLGGELLRHELRGRHAHGVLGEPLGRSGGRLRRGGN